MEQPLYGRNINSSDIPSGNLLHYSQICKRHRIFTFFISLFSFHFLLFYFCLFTLVASLAPFELFAQPVTQEWVARYNSQYNMDDSPNKMTLDKFSNIIVTGSIITPSQGNDIATVKYNTNGVQQWAVTYNQIANTNDVPTGIAADSSGNIYVTGTTGYNIGPFDIVTIKYNSNGIQQWAKIYHGTTGNTDSGPGDIAVDRAGNIYVCGGTGNLSSPGNAVLIKYNSNGDSIWVRRYSVGGLQAGYGSMSIDRFYNIYATGTFSTINRRHSITVKYDSSGVLQWAAQYVSNTNNNDYSTKVALDSSENACVTGATYVGSNSSYLTIKYSNSGFQQWVRNYSGPNGYSESRTLINDKFNNICVTGRSWRSGSIYDIATIKYNSNGDSVWVRRYTGTDNNGGTPKAIAIDDSDNIYILGNTDSGITTIKYNINGVQLWVVSYPGQSVDIAVDGLYNIYVTGANYLNGTADYVTIKYSQLSGILPLSNEIPNDFKLYQNYPNPFNSSTKFEFDVPSAIKRQTQNVKILIYDILGREINTLVNQELKPGTYEAEWNAGSLPSGVYFYQLIAYNFIQTKKMMVVK